MDHEVVIDAVRTLRAGGQRISVRAVHGITGGSFRDVSRLLKESLADDELADLEAEATEPASPPVITEDTPRLGRIAEAEARYEAAKAARKAATVAYRDASWRQWEARVTPVAPRDLGTPETTVATQDARVQQQRLAEIDTKARQEQAEAAATFEARCQSDLEALLRREHDLERDLPRLRQQEAHATREAEAVDREIEALQKHRKKGFRLTSCHAIRPRA